MRKVWTGAKPKRHVTRDFHRRKYGNPLFDRPASRRSKSRGGGKTGVILLAVLGITLFGGGLYYVLWSPALRITSVEITGASPDTETYVRGIFEEQAKGNAALIFPRSNILFFGKERARHAVATSFFFDTLKITKRLPHTLSVQVSEKAMRAALADQGHFYALDDTGRLLRDLTGAEASRIVDLPPDVGTVSSEGLGAEAFDLTKDDAAKTAALPVRNSAQNRNPFPVILGKKTEPGANAVPTATLALILDANARLPDVAAGSVRWFTVQDGADTVDATMDGDWHVLLTTAIPFDIQSERLAVVLREKIGDRKKGLDYVDLRYNERIFFRFKDQPVAP